MRDEAKAKCPKCYGAGKLESKIILVATAVVLLFSSDCAVTDFAKNQYASITHLARGEYYLEAQKYQAGIAVFKKRVAANPDDARAHYYLGRCYLATNKKRSGLKYLKKAAVLNSDKALYHFWLGVAHAANGHSVAERQSYTRALALKPNYVSALVYLGHNQFAAKSYRAALRTYAQALKLAPQHPQALYNRALALKALQRTPEEINAAWRAYLEYYPSGAFAIRAVMHLNAVGNFEYRNYLIGRRTITLPKIRFQPAGADIHKKTRASLNYLGYLVKQSPDLTLQIVVYQKNNRELAETRAKSVKKYLLQRYPAISSQRIKVSWFDVPARIKAGRRTFIEEASVHFFTTY